MHYSIGSSPHRKTKEKDLSLAQRRLKVTCYLAMTVQWIMPIIWTLYCGAALCSMDDLPWPGAIDLLQTVCPYETMCEIPPLKDGIRNTCCQGCSCEDDCSGGTCCFPRGPVSEVETCLFPRTRFIDRYVQSASDVLNKAYYIVTKPPTYGCVNRSGDVCTMKDGASMSPVYSQDRNKIYINGACAACHGVDDVIEWDSALVCDALGASTPLDLERELSKYLRNRSSSACFLSFFLNANPGVASRTCVIADYESLFDNTTYVGNVILDPGFNMSTDDILTACKSNFFAPVKVRQKWYPNPFCFIFDEKEVHSPICYTQSDNVLGLDYMALVSPVVKAILQSEEGMSVPRTSVACLENKTNPRYFENQQCRAVLCPSGHIVGQDGKCIFLGSRVYFKGGSSFSVYLLLQRSDDDANSDDQTLPGRDLTLTDVTRGLQLPPGWSVGMFAIPTDMAGSGTTWRDKLLVRLHPAMMDEGAIASLKKHLTRSIILNDGLVDRIYTQQIYPLPMASTKTNGLYSPNLFCAHDPFTVLDQEIKGQSTPSIFWTTSKSLEVMPDPEINSHNPLQDQMNLNNKGLLLDRNTDFQTTKTDSMNKTDGTTPRHNVDMTATGTATGALRHVPICWTALYSDFRTNSQTIDVSKLYFCDTIELMAGEFRLLANDSVLFYQIQQAYLFEKEFMVHKADSMKTTARICIGDSGFVVDTVANCTIRNTGIITGILLAILSLFIAL